LYELKKVIVGQEHLLERLIVAVITGGHVLVEGAPGLAKTLTLKCLSQVMSLDFKRIQFTPDLLPSDLIGTRIYNPSSGVFTTEVGPIFANFILADEINRAPAKVQSALLEAMQEHQVTIGRETFPLNAPFLVMATQNPIESEGTFNLPEAQLDRFLFKLLIQYPSAEEEMVIIQRMSGEALPELEAILNAESLLNMRTQAQAVYLDPKLMQYIVDLVDATRKSGQSAILYGASPRGSLSLANAAKSLALIHGRTYVTPSDIEKLIHDCLRHRVILSYEGLASGLTPDKYLGDLQTSVPAPVLTGV
jgi:MoxR-like ATPase